MKLNEREKVLVLVFPALLVLAGYSIGFGISAQRKLTNLREDLAKAEQESVTPQQVWQQQSQLQQLTREIKEAKLKKDQLHTQADELCGKMTANRTDMRAINSLTALFDRFNLKLMDETVARSSDAGGMALSLEDARRRLQQSLLKERVAAQKKKKLAPYDMMAYNTLAMTRYGSRTESETNFRRLQFSGGFLNVVRVLNELAQSENQSIPLSITMDEVGLVGMYSDRRTWTLLVKI